jgi:dTDP-4-amino-4,6-dideoxygalactose transaminase
MHTPIHVESVPFVDLTAQHAPLMAELEQAVGNVLRKTNFILGQEVATFEAEFAAYCGASYAVGVDSGTSALELAIRAYGIGAGDEVITTANTFIATVLAITHTGATPVLVDVDPHTYLMDTTTLEHAITERTRAIIPVHLYGQPVDMDAVMAVAERHGLVVIEDAAQAHGARYQGRRAGTLGHAAAFSFYPAKNLGCGGDGGAIVTNNPDVIEYVKIFRNCGQREKNHHVLVGHNHRLDTLQAAILSVKLPHLDGWNAARRQHAGMYHQLLADVEGVVTPQVADDAESVWHLYIIQVDNRDNLREFLAARNIATGLHYPTPIHLQPAYQSLGYSEGSFPVSEQYTRRLVSLPMYAEMTAEHITYVVESIKEFVRVS